MKKSTCPKPTPFQLASIAAQILNRDNGDAASAAIEAVQVWEACASEIEACPKREAEAAEITALHKEQAARRPKAVSNFERLVFFLDFHRPPDRAKSEPVTFEKALAWVMPTMSPSRRLVRFRKVLMVADDVHFYDTSPYFEQLKKRQWFIEQRPSLASFFRRYWRLYLSQQRSKSGSAGGSKHKAKTS